MRWDVDGWQAVLDRWISVSKNAEQTSVPILNEPATEDDVGDLEKRTGRRLPPSYRAFLLTTDGTRETVFPPDRPPIDGFLPAARVRTPTGRDRSNPVWLDSKEGLDRLFEIDGNVAEWLLETDEFFGLQGHLLYAIKIDGGYPETYMYLDPLDMDADGEWRAWDGFKEVCFKRRSFADIIETKIATLEAPVEPAFYKHVVDPSPENEQRLALETQLEAGGAAAERAVEQLVELVASEANAQQRVQAMWALLNSEAPVASEAVLRLLETRPEDGLVVGNALQKGLGMQRTARYRAAWFGALMGPRGPSHAGRLNRQWPELVDEAWQITGDPRFLTELLEVGYEGSLDASIRALADPVLPADVRYMMCYRLGFVAGSQAKKPSQREAIARLVEVPENNRADLVRALLGCQEVDLALSILGDCLEQPSSTVNYLVIKLCELAPPAAVPEMVRSLRRNPNPNAIHVLACIDHIDSAPEIARHLDGPLRVDALIGLEQLGNDAAVRVLVQRASDGDLEAARALARRQDERALHALLKHVDGAYHRSAVTGLRDLRHPSTLPLLTRIAAEDPDDNVAVIAAHGVVMCDASQARPAVEALRQRDDPHVRKLADHWLSLLP